MVDSIMSLATLDLPSDVDALRALAVALQTSLTTTKTELATATVELATTTDALSATTAELRMARASIQLTALEIAKLKAQIAKLKRMQFGQSSERLNGVIDQFELRLEDLEAQEVPRSAQRRQPAFPSPRPGRPGGYHRPNSYPAVISFTQRPALTAVSAAAG